MNIPPAFPTGPFTTADALGRGIKRRQIDQAVRNRVIRRVLQGAYAPAELPDTIELRTSAAALVLNPFVVAGDRTAAWIHGVDVLDYHELDLIPPLETYALRDKVRPQRRGCCRRQRDLRPDDVMTVNGVLVTTPLRTAMDLGCRLSRRSALAAMDALMRAYGFTHQDMVSILERFFGRRGVRQLRELIPLVDPEAESPGESWTRLEIIDAGLPVPRTQYWIVVGGVPVYRLDMAYPHAKVVVEYDGREFHEGDANQKADEERRQWLRRRGWTVIVVDKDSFTDEALAAWLGELRTALRMAA